MPRKKQMTEEELIREKERIEQQIKEVRIKENVEAGRKAFFTKLYKMYLKEKQAEKSKQTFVVPSTNAAVDSEPTYDETMGTSDESMNED